MSIFSRWDNPQKTVMQVVFEKGWTWMDYQQAEDEIEAMLDNTSGEVNLIVDMRSAPTLPSGSALSEIISSLSLTPTKVGIVVIVGASKVMQIILRTTKKLSRDTTGNHIRFAQDPENAREILRSLNVHQSLLDPAFATE
jgi:hypothetical protein